MLKEASPRDLALPLHIGAKPGGIMALTWDKAALFISCYQTTSLQISWWASERSWRAEAQGKH